MLLLTKDKMKKRHLLSFLVVLILLSYTVCAGLGEEQKRDIIGTESLLEGIESSQQTEFKTLPDNTKEISNLPSFTTKTGATGKEVSLLKLLSESLLIATA